MEGSLLVHVSYEATRTLGGVGVVLDHLLASPAYRGAFPRTLLDGIAFDPTMRAYEDWDWLLGVFDREMPRHVPVLGSRVFEVPDETTDRRGASTQANDLNAVYDYLYVYRRHPAPTAELKARRAALMQAHGIPAPPAMY